MCITSDLFSTGVGVFDVGVRMFWSVELRLLCHRLNDCNSLSRNDDTK